MDVCLMLMVLILISNVSCHPGEIFGSNALNPIPQDAHAPYNEYDNNYGPNYHDAIHIDLHKDTLDLIKMKMQELQMMHAEIKQHLAEKKLNYKLALTEKLLAGKEKKKPNILIDYVNPESYHHESYAYAPHPQQPSYAAYSYSQQSGQQGNKQNHYDPYSTYY